MIIRFIKKLQANKKAKFIAKCRRMKSEIICAIAYDEKKKQEKSAVNIPMFLTVKRRYENLGIRSFKDLYRTYAEFSQQQLVSGIEL